ncbi:MAG: efflux RND transporter periplasmic adaptor subunit [Bacteroidales bacterium]|nr:efflux RND transporter periplasmic adaptor subunit [Candidatus Colimorpha merdihippi]
MNKATKLTVFALAALIMASCGGKKEEKTATTSKKEAEKVKVQVLQSERIAKNIELAATLEGYETMNISPSITGHIEHIYVQVGSRVAKGASLVRMDQTQLNTTRINLASVKVELDRMTALKASGTVSQQAYDQLKTQYDQLVESERFQNENTHVKAQFAGVISAKNYEDGEMYAGAPILTLTQINKLKTLVSIPESFYPLVKPGMKLEIKSDIYKGQTFPASIEIVYPTIDPMTHTFQCKLSIPNGGEKLRPGMYVKATLALGEVDAIVVPYQSVLKLTGSNDRYVFTNQDGAAHRVAVTLGQRYDDRIEIIPVTPGDLKEGDQLVVTGQGRLVDGATLEVIK